MLASLSVQCDRRHAERLLPVTTFVLNEAGLAFEDVDVLAVSVGPGSFTGLRLGVATWKGLALARELPLVGVPTLDAMSRRADAWKGPVCPLIDARMDEVYGALYVFDDAGRRCLVPPSVGPVERLLEETPAETLFFGDGALRYEERIRACLSAARLLPQHHGAVAATAVAAEAAAMLEAGAPSDAAEVEPVYLRKSQAEMNREEAAGVVAP